LVEAGRNRLYIDWLYTRLFVEPMEWFASLCAWFDRNLIDGVVHAVAATPRMMGTLGQRVQTGRVPAYSFLTAIAIAAVAIWVVTRSTW
jgi:NADH-quinone oxidoreductase subunit L